MCATDTPARRGFNPRSRGGSDGKNVIFVAHEIVSIHAPAGGATLGKTVVTLTALFQSTLPRGERPEHYLSGPYAVGVSIHAPAGGATPQ